MQFKCGKTNEEKAVLSQARYDEGLRLATTWTKKFAWFPKTIRPGKCVWLEYYERNLHAIARTYTYHTSPKDMAIVLMLRVGGTKVWKLREITK